jgi:hypothetical protein
VQGPRTFDRRRYVPIRHSPARMLRPRVPLLPNLQVTHLPERVPPGREVYSDRSLCKAVLPGRVTRKLVRRCSIRISGKLPPARRRAARRRCRRLTENSQDSVYISGGVQNPGSGNFGPEPSQTLDHASGGRWSGIASFARRTETSSEPGSHQSMRSWARMVPPTTILQLSPERFSSALNTFLAIRFSR